MASVHLDITGMHCGHCVTTVKDALQRVNGVWATEVGLEEGTAHVAFDDQTASANALIQAVEGVGYGAKVQG